MSREECVWHNRADIRWREGLNDMKLTSPLADPDPERDVVIIAVDFFENNEVNMKKT